VSFAYDQHDLEEVEKAIERERPSCSRPSDIMLVADLMRLVGENWKEDGKLERADSAYQTAYEYVSNAPNNVLGKISVLQAWASLKVQLNAFLTAQKFARMQSSVAQQAYSDRKFGPELVASSLRFEATILASTGRLEEADTREAEASTLLATAKKCVGLCLRKN
jgi:hypothetical protein